MSRILVDTNILIYREDVKEVPEEVQELFKILGKTSRNIVIHPLSFDDIERNKDSERKKLVRSKIKSYPTLEDPPSYENDEEFLSSTGRPKNPRDQVDYALLYCVYKDVVSFLITEDEKIHRLASKLGLSERVFRISEAIEYFKKEVISEILHPPQLELRPMYSLDLKDPIFDYLREDYSEFDDWWKEKSREGRKAWVYFIDGDKKKIGALLILKDEEEPIDSTPPLPKKRRLKICTFIVSPECRGYKIGELFIKLSVQTAVEKGISEIYLTHFTKKNDFLVTLIEDFGFIKIAKKNNGEDIFVKYLLPDKDDLNFYPPQSIYRRFYPSFYEGEKVDKFIVPIQPKWFIRLFPEYKQPRTLTFEESKGKFIVEGNTLKKAYLCHAKIKGLKEGDLLLFYQSSPIKKLTSLGIVERVYENVIDPEKAIQYTAKRTVYLPSDIKKIVEKPTKIILFWWVMHFKNPLSYGDLKNYGILKTPLQTIVKISHNEYLKIKKKVGIDDRYTVN